MTARHYAERFAGHRAVITGGAAGIGLTFAKRFATEGGAVSLRDISQEALAQTRRPPKSGAWGAACAASGPKHIGDIDHEFPGNAHASRRRHRQGHLAPCAIFAADVRAGLPGPRQYRLRQE